MAGKLRTQNYHCEECVLTSDHLIELSHDVVSSTEACPETQPCPQCGGPAVRVFSAPNLMQRAFPDGVDRGDAWKITKEAAKLRAESNKKNYKKRGEEAKEIRNLEKRAMTAPKKFVE